MPISISGGSPYRIHNPNSAAPSSVHAQAPSAPGGSSSAHQKAPAAGGSNYAHQKAPAAPDRQPVAAGAGSAGSSASTATSASASAQASSSYSMSDLSALFGSGCDLAVVIFAMQIEQQDRNIANLLTQIDQIGKMRDAYNDRLDGLRKLKDIVVSTNGSTDHDADSKATMGEIAAKAGDKLKELPLQKAEMSVDPNTGAVKWQETGPLGQLEEQTYMITAENIDAEIKRLEGQAQKLDSQREIKIIELNQQVNKKEQAVTQLTTLIKKANDTHMAIINNLK
jgi:hypothetical protein